MGMLDGKVAIITGAGTGIGRESAILLAADGAKTVLVGRRADVLEEVAATIRASGGDASVRAADIARKADVEALAAFAAATYGPVDILINNAGSAGRVRDPRWLSEDEWRTTIDVNLTAVWLLTQAVLPSMLERASGTIITVSSLAALNPNLLGGAAYGAAKAGVVNFMQFLHNTYRQQGLRATTILPGEADTPIMDQRPRPPTPAERAMMLAPGDVARAVHLCASLPPGAMIPELRICPTIPRDISADLEAARRIGMPPSMIAKDRP
jgi:NADP-dependent 3-hydroxy acid dehydrogenase YdfG